MTSFSAETYHCAAPIQDSSGFSNEPPKFLPHLLFALHRTRFPLFLHEGLAQQFDNLCSNTLSVMNSLTSYASFPVLPSASSTVSSLYFRFIISFSFPPRCRCLSYLCVICLSPIRSMSKDFYLFYLPPCMYCLAHKLSYVRF